MDDPLPAALATDLDAAFEALVRAHQDRLYTIAWRVLGDRRDAEEVTQDALVRAYRAIAGYEPERTRRLQLRPWLATITLNLCRNRRRRREPVLVALATDAGESSRGPGSRTVHEPPATDTASLPHEAAAEREANRHWAALLAELPDRYRLPVVLRHVDGLSYEEAAEALGRPVGTVKAQVHRGVARLRAAAEAASTAEAAHVPADHEELSA